VDWIYLASPSQTDLPSTLEAVLQNQLLWRPARNSLGALIANIGRLRINDWIVLAWREDRHAYLRCRIGAPANPAQDDGRKLVVDRIATAEADGLAALGYRAGSDGAFEAIRFDEVEACYFPLRGHYGGNNALHRIDELDLAAVGTGSTIPPVAAERAPDIVARSTRPSRSAAAAGNAPGGQMSIHPQSRVANPPIAGSVVP
jgi:hypothetical protein